MPDPYLAGGSVCPGHNSDGMLFLAGFDSIASIFHGSLLKRNVRHRTGGPKGSAAATSPSIPPSFVT